MSEVQMEGALRSETERVKRVSDMLVTAHSYLREKYNRLSLSLDLSILALSIWLTSVVFIEPKISVKLTPFQLDPQIWVGLLGVFTLFLSILQLRVDWKGTSEAHGHSAEMYAKTKNECRRMLESAVPLTRENCQSVFTHYDLCSDLGRPIPEGEFLKLKRRHLCKVAISRYLDTHPAQSLTLIRARIWWRDNVRLGKGLLK